ncbi:MAG TPA: phosphopantothenoylcysteine decarboxylase [Planctomycetota bacterium]|nr:phosphopantothenoylcysteine decarboxylase [Planctomycetota bacterium]
MRVLITAGGTREPIDDARVIANVSTGRLGARLADAAAAGGHEVLLLHGVHAVRPSSPRVRCEVFDTGADLARLLERHVPASDAVIHAAAVSDYVPVRAPGKIASDQPELLLRFERAPKLVDRLRELRPSALLVGFKLAADADEAGLLAAAQALRARARLDLVVANVTGRTGEDDHEALLVGEAGVLQRCRSKAAIAQALVTLLGAHAPGAA